MTIGGKCGKLSKNEEEVTASHLELKANGVNRVSGKVPELLYSAVKNVLFHRIFCFIKARGCFVINKDLLINEEIREKEVRVIGSDGSQLGIMPSKDALSVAASKNLDLVLIAPKATPPTCKIMDYGKYRFEMAKREKENRKNQKVVSIKEVRLSPSIDTHDFETKLKSAVKFLRDGDKVKVTVRFRGREVHHSALGEELLERFAEGIKEVGTVDKKPKLEGRNMAMFVVPKN